MLKKCTAICAAILILISLSAFAEPKQFSMAGYESNTSRDWNTNAFFSRMEELTGVKWSFTQYSDSPLWHNWVDSLTASSPLPDAFFKADLTDWEMIELYRKGVLCDLSPWIEQCMPNFSAMTEHYPEVMDEITLTVDGKKVIVSLPYINETPLNCALWVNTRWLKNVGMTLDEITDIESFEKMLTAFRDRDPNMNGKRDEIPLSFIGVFDLKFLAGMFGMAASNYNVFSRDGKACFLAADERFFGYVEWLKKLYTEGLIDKNGFSTSESLRDITSESDTNIYGVVIAPTVTGIVPSNQTGDYALLMPFASQGGVWRKYYTNTVAGTFSVTSACSDIASVLSWADSFYTPETAVLASIGERGKEYGLSNDELSFDEFLESGEAATWSILSEQSMIGSMQTTQLIAGSSAYPGYSADQFQRKYEDRSIESIYTQLGALNAVSVLPFPVCPLTSEELAYISPLQNKIAYALDMQMTCWITGDTELNEESCAGFVKSLEDLDAFMNFWQKKLDDISAEIN